MAYRRLILIASTSLAACSAGASDEPHGESDSTIEVTLVQGGSTVGKFARFEIHGFVSDQIYDGVAVTDVVTDEHANLREAGRLGMHRAALLDATDEIGLARIEIEVDLDYGETLTGFLDYEVVDAKLVLTDDCAGATTLTNGSHSISYRLESTVDDRTPVGTAENILTASDANGNPLPIRFGNGYASAQFDVTGDAVHLMAPAYGFGQTLKFVGPADVTSLEITDSETRMDRDCFEGDCSKAPLLAYTEVAVGFKMGTEKLCVQRAELIAGTVVSGECSVIPAWRSALQIVNSIDQPCEVEGWKCRWLTDRMLRRSLSSLPRRHLDRSGLRRHLRPSRRSAP